MCRSEEHKPLSTLQPVLVRHSMRRQLCSQERLTGKKENEKIDEEKKIINYGEKEVNEAEQQ